MARVLQSVGRAGKNAEVIARHPLRFMRSSSSSMPPQVIRELLESVPRSLLSSNLGSNAGANRCNPLMEAAEIKRPFDGLWVR